MNVNFSPIVDYYCAAMRVAKIELIRYLEISEPTFYTKMKNNKWLFSEIENMATFFDMAINDFIDFLGAKKKPVPGEHAGRSLLDQNIALKQEIAYLKKINELLEKQ